MVKSFSSSESHILSLCKIGEEFNYKGNSFRILNSGKPGSSKGEPKTDIYLKCLNNQNKCIEEFKITYKQINADFLENKISKERAVQLFGENWKQYLIDSIKKIQIKFLERKLIFKENFKRTEKGSFTVGWKFELLNVLSGELSSEVIIPYKILHDVYSGKNLEENKKNALVNGEKIENSGIATHILFSQVDVINNIQDIFDNLFLIEEYLSKGENSKIYFACKALNYRSFLDKYDGDRPLAVYVDWKIKDKKLFAQLIYDNPLEIKGNAVVEKLKESLSIINIQNTDQISKKNIHADCSEILFD